MNKILISFFCTFFFFVGYSQEQKVDTISRNYTSETVFHRVEKMPEFPGGKNALMEFIGKNVVYPPKAIKRKLEGTVVIRFVIDETGKVTNPEIIKSVDPLLDEAALDVVYLLPNFIPGQQKGKNVKVNYIVPIKFTLSH